jgi:hypothetical protein
MFIIPDRVKRGGFFLQMTFTKVSYRRFHLNLINGYSDIHNLPGKFG